MCAPRYEVAPVPRYGRPGLLREHGGFVRLSPGRALQHGLDDFGRQTCAWTRDSNHQQVLIREVPCSVEIAVGVLAAALTVVQNALVVDQTDHRTEQLLLGVDGTGGLSSPRSDRVAGPILADRTRVREVDERDVWTRGRVRTVGHVRVVHSTVPVPAAPGERHGVGQIVPEGLSLLGPVQRVRCRVRNDHGIGRGDRVVCRVRRRRRCGTGRTEATRRRDHWRCRGLRRAAAAGEESSGRDANTTDCHEGNDPKNSSANTARHGVTSFRVVMYKIQRCSTEG